MVLVDTSVWVAHLRHGAIGLDALLNEGRVVCHPFIVGELACGNLKHRSEILVHLRALPQVILADHEEVMRFIENCRLMGKDVPGRKRRWRYECVAKQKRRKGFCQKKGFM